MAIPWAAPEREAENGELTDPMPSETRKHILLSFLPAQTEKIERLGEKERAKDRVGQERRVVGKGEGERKGQ